MDKSGSTLILVCIALSMFLDGLDGTIVNIALPEIADSFGMGTGDTSWVVTVYFLMMAGLILVFGRICDKGAIKKVLMAGMIVFGFGSLFCGLSPNFAILIASRAFQGIGAAMIASSAVMLGVKYLPREKLGLSMSIVVIGSAVGIAIGPTVGAVLTEYFSWHWIFFINFPIALLAAALVHRAIPADRELEKGDLDIAGSTMLFVAVVLGLFVIERLPSEGLSTIGVAALVGCVVLFILFVSYERKKTNPVLELRLFRNRDYVMATAAYIIVSMVVMGVIYLIPFFMKGVLGFDTLESGLFLSLQAISIIICSMTAGKYSERGNRPFGLTSCIMTVVFTCTALFYGADMSLVYLGASLLIMGTIWGIGGGPLGAIIVESVDEDDSGSASSMVSFSMYFSSALGTAMFAGLFGFGSGSGSSSLSDLPADVFMDGFTFAVAFGVVFAIIAFILSWMVRTERRSG